MSISVQKAPSIHKTVILPASKSISNRALIISALAHTTGQPGQQTETTNSLSNVSDCDDTFVMTRALKSDSPIIDIMAAGTSMRFLTAYLSVTGGERVITGTERMKHRPISILVDALRTLGADIAYEEEEGFPPLRIRGKKLEGGPITLPGNVSSQYISAMLMIGPTLQKGLTLTLTDGIASRPYIDMTLSIMRDFGAEADWTGEDTITVQPTPYRTIPYCIENDWSASSYWFELVALTPDSEVTLPGLQEKSLQGDSVVKDIFANLGVEMNGQTLYHTGRKTGRLDIDMTDCPDLAQTVVVTCCMLEVPFCISGLQSLKIKETDRITALRAELSKLGYAIEEEDDRILKWDGSHIEPKWETDTDGTRHLAAIDTYEDHRMAMSFAPCAQVLGEVRINHPEVVSKSYPKFWEDLGVKQEKE